MFGNNVQRNFRSGDVGTVKLDQVGDHARQLRILKASSVLASATKPGTSSEVATQTVAVLSHMARTMIILLLMPKL